MAVIECLQFLNIRICKFDKIVTSAVNIVFV